MGQQSRRVTILGTLTIGLCTFAIYKAGTATLIALKGGTHEFDRLFDYPLWAIIHFVAAGLFMTLLPFQLWAGFRDRHRSLHRRSGRAMFAAGLTMSASGWFLPFAMPARPVSEKIYMVMISSLFAFFLARAVVAARRRNLVSHREWMIRAAAGACGAMVQRLVFPVFPIVLGIHSLREFWEYFVASNWLTTGMVLGTAEWWIRTSIPKTFARNEPVENFTATQLQTR